MKKVLSYLIFVLSVISCRKIETPAVMSDEISFSDPTMMTTRVSNLVTDADMLIVKENTLGYGVFASRYMVADPENTHESFMDDILVSCAVGGDTWSYDADSSKDGNQSLYWSPGAAYKFFAIYPYYDKDNDKYDLGISYSIDETEHALKVTGRHNAGDGEKMLICTGDENGNSLCPDILYAVKKYAEPYKVGEEREQVSFEMNHALSALSFKFRNASEYTIKSVTAGSISDFKNAADYVLLSENGARWSGLQDVDHEFTVPDITTTVKPGDYYPSQNSAYWYTEFMIPQNFGTYQNSPSFTFTVTFSDDSNKTYTIKFKDYQVNSTAEHAYTYLSGNHYVYTINVTASKISCDVDIVPWIEDEPIKLN